MPCLGSGKIVSPSSAPYESLTLRDLSCLLLFRHQVSHSLRKSRVGAGRMKRSEMAMYLVKRFCDRTLPEIADYFGTNGYATVSWNCRVVESKMAMERKFKDRLEKIAASILDH